MTKDEIIASLLDQLKDTNNQGTALTGRVNELLATNSVRYAVSDSGDMRSLVFQVFLRLQS